MKLLLRTCLALILLFLVACENKEDYQIEYASGNPSPFVGNWIAYEFQGGNPFETGLTYNDYIILDTVGGEYDLVTALMPSDPSQLIIDNLYNSDVRVMAKIDSDSVKVVKGPQLDVINKPYDIETVSVKGVLKDFEEISDVLTLEVGMYDKTDILVDTVFIVALRKTGFEEVDQY
jgi:hypothetical protein